MTIILECDDCGGQERRNPGQEIRWGDRAAQYDHGAIYATKLRCTACHKAILDASDKALAGRRALKAKVEA